MKQFLITVAGVFSALVLFFLVIPILILFLVIGAAQPPAAPSQAVLAIDLRGGLSDQDSPNAFLPFAGPSMSVMSVVDALRRAGTDDRIKGVLIRLPDGGMDPAAADELRQAVHRFRTSKKPVFAHSQGLYAAGVVTSTYMLGAAADELWMQPGAPFEVTGLTTEDIFFKRAFDRFGVEAEFEQRQEFKNAVNPYLFADYTPAHLEAQRAWMTQIYEAALTATATDRKIAPAQLKSAIEAGPYDAGQAASNGLIDRVGQAYEAEKRLKERVKAEHVVDFYDYVAEPSSPGGRAPTIAVIRAEGNIVTGYANVDPFGGQNVYADQVAEAFYSAAEDEDVKAIIFRVSSPGGMDTASDQIAAAVRAAKAAGKPVVVSMGTYAASGGYWISADASRIIAQPTTLTGSIGVYGGKFAIGEAAGRYGVDFRQTSVGGQFAGATSMGQEFTPAQRAAYAAQVDRIYERFIATVANGRKLPPDRVREIAKGRVWTGAQAQQLGLVDQLGGFTEAVDAAKSLAKIEGPVRLKLLPPQVSPFEALEKALGVSAEGARTLAAAGWLLGDPRAKAVMDDLMEARLRSKGAYTLAPTPF